MITDGGSPFGFLALLALVFGTPLVLAAIAVALYSKRPDFATRIAKLAGAGVAAYAVLLLLGAATSESRVLGANQEKHICEVDCHLAYSVVGVKAAGRQYVVTVKVRFDEQTISPHRGMWPLTPNGRRVALVDARGRRYPGSADGLRRQLVPGESYTTDLTFEVPEDARELRLELVSGEPETALLIGHENSIFHRETTFRVAP